MHFSCHFCILIIDYIANGKYLAFHYLLLTKDFIVFKKKLSGQIDNLIQYVIHIDEESFHQMGFPTNWKDITRYHYTPQVRKQ